MTNLWVKASKMGQLDNRQSNGQSSDQSNSRSNGQSTGQSNGGQANGLNGHNDDFYSEQGGRRGHSKPDRQKSVIAGLLAVPIYSGGSTPASPEAQVRVDRLIDYVNSQIELLAFDEPDPRVLRQMVNCLVDPRRSTRLNLVESFSEVGELATPFLLEGLAEHPESVVRRACCNALTNIGDPDSVPGLITALLKDADIGVKSAAAGALAKVGAPAFDALREVLASKEASESCKGHAAWAMASMSSEVGERLYRIMGDPSAAVRTAVIGAIAQLVHKQTAQSSESVPLEVGQPQNGYLPPAQAAGGQSFGAAHFRGRQPTELPKPPRTEKVQRALTMLTEALNDQSAEVRIEAAANLARLNCQKAYQPLVACLRDPIAAVRRAAALALAKLGNPDAIEAIAHLQRDAEESVQRVAALVVAQLQVIKVAKDKAKEQAKAQSKKAG